MQILINAISLKQGGGLYILDNLIKHLSPKLKTIWIVPLGKNKMINNHLYVKIPLFLYSKYFLFIYYFKFVKKIVSKYNIDIIWNFGDIIIPNIYNQIYYFDWAYAVYDEDYIWSKMPLKEKFVRKLKVLLIKRYINTVKLVVVQTENTKRRLVEKYNTKNIFVLPTPIEFPKYNLKDEGGRIGNLMNKRNINFIYISSYATHKNHNILIPLAKKIKEKKLNYKIFVTILKSDDNEFLNAVVDDKLDDTIINLGLLKHSDVAHAYFHCHAVLFPSLLESYGIPFYEAMKFNKPIFTSDLDFAKDACEDFAFYFDPFDWLSIFNSMDQIHNKTQIKINIKKGSTKVANLPSWEQFIDKFIQKSREFYYE